MKLYIIVLLSFLMSDSTGYLDNRARVEMESIVPEFYEKEEIDFWLLVHQLIQANIYQMELDDFDDKYFGNYTYKSHITSKRNDMFNKINNELGYTFVETTKSSVDKRRKLVKFNI